MRRATKMCKTCPFRGIEETERKGLATIPAEEWACHTEQGYSYSCDIQCRGHWEAQRKYPAAPLSGLDEDLLRDLPVEIWLESDIGQSLLALAKEGRCRYTRLNSTLGRFEPLSSLTSNLSPPQRE